MRARLASCGTLAALALAACQKPDVGDPCVLDVVKPTGPIDAYVSDGVACSADTADYFRSGANECDNLICIRSAPGPACTSTSATVVAAYPSDIRKYCSKACVSDADCKNDRIKLVCRTIVLDSAYLAFLQQCAADQAAGVTPNPACPPNAAGALLLLGGITSSTYCAAPRP